jgi:invasion protein IalB
MACECACRHSARFPRFARCGARNRAQRQWRKFAWDGRRSSDPVASAPRGPGLPSLSRCCARSRVSPAGAQGAVKPTHGDWQMRCETFPPAAQTRAMRAGPEASPPRTGPTSRLLVVVLKHRRPARAGCLRVVAPLGVLLPSGPRPQGRSTTTSAAPASCAACRPSGCVAEVVMDDTLLGQLKTGKMRHIRRVS